MEIDAGWTTPKFWTQLGKALFGSAVDLASLDEAQMTNEAVRLTFLSRFHHAGNV